jgi:hypothetical protein
MLGLVFLFAVIWKVLGGEYWDGTFWEYSLLTSPRTKVPAQLLGNLSPTVIADNIAALRSLVDPLANVDAITLAGSESLRGPAITIGWFGLLLEALIAIAFLVPAPSSVPVHTIRAALMLVFLGVFLFVPVLGFAWILVALTVASIPRGELESLKIAVIAAALGIVMIDGVRVFVYAALDRG